MERKINPDFAHAKLGMLAEEHGCTFEELLDMKGTKSTFPGICMRRGCFFIEEYGPEEEAGWCEECATATVISGLVLAKIRGGRGKEEKVQKITQDLLSALESGA